MQPLIPSMRFRMWRIRCRLECGPSQPVDISTRTWTCLAPDSLESSWEEIIWRTTITTRLHLRLRLTGWRMVLQLCLHQPIFPPRMWPTRRKSSMRRMRPATTLQSRYHRKPKLDSTMHPPIWFKSQKSTRAKQHYHQSIKAAKWHQTLFTSKFFFWPKFFPLPRIRGYEIWIRL